MKSKSPPKPIQITHTPPPKGKTPQVPKRTSNPTPQGSNYPHTTPQRQNAPPGAFVPNKPWPGEDKTGKDQHDPCFFKGGYPEVHHPPGAFVPGKPWPDEDKTGRDQHDPCFFKGGYPEAHHPPGAFVPGKPWPGEDNTDKDQHDPCVFNETHPSGASMPSKSHNTPAVEATPTTTTQPRAQPLPAASVGADWQAAAELEAEAFPDLRISDLPCISAATLAAAGEFTKANKTENGRPGVSLPPGFASAATPPPKDVLFPTTNPMPNTARPAPAPPEELSGSQLTARWREELGRPVRLADIQPEPKPGQQRIGVRISKWIKAAKRYNRSVAAHATSGHRLLRRPQDMAIPLEEMLIPRARPYIWNTADKYNVFAVDEDSTPFATDDSLSIDAEYLLSEAERLGCPDQELLSMLRSGISLQNTEPLSRVTFLCVNAKSYIQHCVATEQEIEQQVEDGWATPHSGDWLPWAPCRIHPQGSTAKRRSDKRRRTSNFSMDLGGFRGQAVNDAIDAKKLPRAPLPTTSMFAKTLEALRAGAGANEVKCLALDLKSAFSQLVYKEHELWVACSIYSQYIITEKRLAFGMSSSPNVYQRLASLCMASARDHFDTCEANDPILDEMGDSTFWSGRPPGVQSRRAHCSMYLDDPSVAAVGEKRAVRLAMVIAATFQRCGLPTSDKSQGPHSILNLLGLTFHADLGLVDAPQDKVDFLVAQLDSLLISPDGTATELFDQSDLRSTLFGMLFLAPAVRNLRPCLNLGFKFAFSKSTRGCIVPPPELREDLFRAKRALLSKTAQPLRAASARRFVNGQIPDVPDATSGLHADFSSDAAKSASGFKLAATFKGHYILFEMPAGSEDIAKFLSISHLELVAVFAGLITFGNKTADAVIRCLCDNAAATSCINTGIARDPAMSVATSAVFDRCARTATTLGAAFTRTVANTASDMLTRNEMEGFLARCIEKSFKPCRLEWPAEATVLLDSMVTINRAMHETKFDEQSQGWPGAAGKNAAEMSPEEIEDASAQGALSFDFKLAQA